MTEIVSQKSINPHSNDKFRIVISNIPSIEGKIRDIKWLYENFVKTFSLPDYGLNLIASSFKGTDYLRPIGRKNNDLKPFSVEFFADDKLYNYFYMFKFILQHRYAELDLANPATVRHSQRPETYDHNFDINELDLLILDNEKRVVNTVKFKGVFITGLSNINFKSGSNEQTSFNVEFNYREILMDLPENL